MVELDPVADLERRLKAGEWLGTAQLATLFRRDRTTIYRWAVKRGLMGYRKSAGGGEIECDPADVLRLLAAHREVHRATTVPEGQ